MDRWLLIDQFGLCRLMLNIQGEFITQRRENASRKKKITLAYAKEAKKAKEATEKPAAPQAKASASAAQAKTAKIG